MPRAARQSARDTVRSGGDRCSRLRPGGEPRRTRQTARSRLHRRAHRVRHLQRCERHECPIRSRLRLQVPLARHEPRDQPEGRAQPAPSLQRAHRRHRPGAPRRHEARGCLLFSPLREEAKQLLN